MDHAVGTLDVGFDNSRTVDEYFMTLRSYDKILSAEGFDLIEHYDVLRKNTAVSYVMIKKVVQLVFAVRAKKLVYGAIGKSGESFVGRGKDRERPPVFETVNKRNFLGDRRKDTALEGSAESIGYVS